MHGELFGRGVIRMNQQEVAAGQFGANPGEVDRKHGQLTGIQRMLQDLRSEMPLHDAVESQLHRELQQGAVKDSLNRPIAFVPKPA